MKLEHKLQEALNRYNRINSYVVHLKEQVTPPADAAAPLEPPADAAPAADPTAEAPAPPPANAPAMPDANALPPTPDQAAAMKQPDAAPAAATETVGETEGLDVTELVNMTKEIKSKLDGETKKHEEAVHKMDTVFSKLDDLANQLQNMDQIIQKIDDLESKVKEMKPLTPEEKLNLRSYDSYPFNQKLTDFFEDKQQQMKMTGKNEYVLKPEDLDYTKDDIVDSFG
jgi:hypothetical protein